MKKYLVSLFLILALCFSLAACVKEETLTLSFMVDGELYQENIYYSAGGVRAPVNPPKKEGYTFNGWYYDKGNWEYIFDETYFNREFKEAAYTLHARFEPYAFTLNADNVSYTLTEAFSTATGDIVIPSRYMDKPVTAIADGVFSGRTDITSVTIPDSITSIGASAFSGTGIKTLILPSGIKTLGGRAFSECVKLEIVSLGSVLYRIAPSAFEGCTALTTVIIPRSVEYIDEAAFKGCESLTSIALPALLDQIGTSAFEGCVSLDVIDLPNGLVSVADRAFFGATNARVTLPDTAQHIGESAFDGVKSVSMGKNLLTVGKAAFANMTGEISYRGEVAAFEAIPLLHASWSEGRTLSIVCTDGEIAPLPSTTED